MSPFAASLRREWRLLRSRPRDWAMVSWVPLLAMALMCWIFSAGQPQRLPIAVWNEDGASPLSRQLVRMLEATPGFARDVQRGAGASVALLHNAQLATHSSLLQRDVRQVVGTLSAGVEMQALAKRGTPARALQLRVEPIRTQLVALFNVSTNYEQFLATTLVPALVHILAMTAGAWSVGRELRDRTLGQWLHGAGGAAAVLAALLGKLLAPLALLWASALACLLYLSQLRGWAVAGSLAWIALGLALLVAVSLAAGAALAGLTLSLRTAMSGAGLLSAPAFAFSGVGFPLLAMSGSARTWAEAMPYTHYARLQIEQWQMSAPPAQSLPVVAGPVEATALGNV